MVFPFEYRGVYLGIPRAGLLSNGAGLKRNPAPERDRWTFHETIIPRQGNPGRLQRMVKTGKWEVMMKGSAGLFPFHRFCG